MINRTVSSEYLMKQCNDKKYFERMKRRTGCLLLDMYEKKIMNVKASNVIEWCEKRNDMTDDECFILIEYVKRLNQDEIIYLIMRTYKERLYQRKKYDELKKDPEAYARHRARCNERSRANAKERYMLHKEQFQAKYQRKKSV